MLFYYNLWRSPHSSTAENYCSSYISTVVCSWGRLPYSPREQSYLDTNLVCFAAGDECPLIGGCEGPQSGLISVWKNVNTSCRAWFVSHFSNAACTLIFIHVQHLTHLKRQLKLSSHIPFSWTGLTNSAFLRQQCWTHCRAVIGNFWGSSLICLSSSFPTEEEKSGKVWTGDESSRERR